MSEVCLNANVDVDAEDLKCTEPYPSDTDTSYLETTCVQIRTQSYIFCLSYFNTQFWNTFDTLKKLFPLMFYASPRQEIINNFNSMARRVDESLVSMRDYLCQASQDLIPLPVYRHYREQYEENKKYVQEYMLEHQDKVDRLNQRLATIHEEEEERSEFCL